MKSLSEHFIDIISHLDIPQEAIDYAHLRISELTVEELHKILLNKKLQKGGELVDKQDLLKCEGNIKEFTLRNEIYKLCVREIKQDKNSPEYYIINFYSPSMNCVILQIKLNEKKAKLTELLKQEGCLMKQVNNQYETIPKETGILLVEIVIKICKKFGIDNLYLTDNSHILCKNNSHSRINLLYSKMMLDGDSWYGKFGFEPVEEIDKKTYKENQENFKKNILTQNIKKETFIKKILNKEKNKNDIEKILKKYEEMKKEKLCVFMKWISENYCSIYSEIYEYIYDKAGYKKYTTLEFVLKFNTDLTEFVNMVKNKKI